MFERAVLDELPLWYFLVVIDEAIREAQVKLGVGVFAGGAEKNDIAKAFGLAVFALDAVVFVGKSGTCEYGYTGSMSEWRTYWPMKDSLKSTLSDMLAMVGTTSF